MAVLNPDHLFDQADRLIQPLVPGKPRQVDLRRAISAAYYAVFHYILTKAADQCVGAANRGTKNYSLVYRSVDHRALRDLCMETKKSTPSAKYIKHIPDSGFGPNIPAFASALVELQEKRHSADYDPAYRVKTSDARLAIAQARSAIARFENSKDYRKRSFVSLLLFAPR